MAIVYNKTHTITFYCDSKGIFRNSWGHFHLVPTTRPYVNMPSPRVVMVSLPRANRILDLTNALTKDVTFEPREGDWDFIIDHDQWEDWTKSFDELSEFFDGSIMRVILEDEPLYEYKGRVYISNYKADSSYSSITLHYSFDAIAKELTKIDLDSEISSYENGVTVSNDNGSSHLIRLRQINMYDKNIPETSYIDIKLDGINRTANFYLKNELYTVEITNLLDDYSYFIKSDRLKTNISFVGRIFIPDSKFSESFLNGSDVWLYTDDDTIRDGEYKLTISYYVEHAEIII